MDLSSVRDILMVMDDLELRSETLADGAMLNVVVFDSKPALEVVIDNLDPTTGHPRIGQRAESSFMWPVQSSLPLKTLLKDAEELYKAYQLGTCPTRFEMWLEDVHYEQDRLGTGGRFADELLTYAATKRVRPTDRLQLLLVAAGDLLVEWRFAGDRAVSCSCSCTIVLAQSLARFFRNSHYDPRLKSQGELSQRIFANGGNAPLNAFKPLQIIP